ncbi:MAG: DUF5074 domain-containing protein [Marinifilaceae bacterium]
MKKIIFSLLLAICAITISCNNEEEVIIPQIEMPEISLVIEGIENNAQIVQNKELELKAVVTNCEEYTTQWQINGTIACQEPIFKYTPTEIGSQTISVTIVNADKKQKTEQLTLHVYGKYKHGTFVLNEGNMTTGNGTLLFISPEGSITDSIYCRANGPGSSLGNTTQDLYITNNKVYIMSQNGGGDGRLIVANAETMKKVSAYETPLASLSMPSHVAVIDNNAYIRDNKGINYFNLNTNELTLIDGTSGAAKNRMAVINNKVFAAAGKNVHVLSNGQVTNTIIMPGTVSGIVKSHDNQLWVSCTTSPAQILKVDATDYTIIKSNSLNDAKIGAGFGATPAFSAKNDTIYFSNASTRIYRHIFNQDKTEYITDVTEHVEDAGMTYNNLAVHPLTGHVYFTTIKGYGLNYLINNISVFNFSTPTPTLSQNYKNYTHFPAGIFFTDNF